MTNNSQNEPSLYIHQYLQWNDNQVRLNGQLLFQFVGETSLDTCVEFYKNAAFNYLKFFKMDLLSKAAFLSAQMVIPKEIEENKSKIATFLSSKSGCIDVDKKFEDSINDIASPALFVYTLPNIMLGEICIVNGFKGEQMCTLSEDADSDWFEFYIGDLIRRRDTEAALCGHIEATEAGINSTMIWVSKQWSSIPFNMQNLQTIFKNR